MNGSWLSSSSLKDDDNDENDDNNDNSMAHKGVFILQLLTHTHTHTGGRALSKYKWNSFKVNNCESMKE